MFQNFSQPATPTLRRADAASTQSPARSRLAVCPPAARRPHKMTKPHPPTPAHTHTHTHGANWRQQLGYWIDSAWPSLLGATRQADSSKLVLGAAPLARVRADFATSLIDIDTLPASDAQQRIARAPSLHELWHVRAQVFDLVSRHHDQAEAERRLARLNRHFPTRTPAAWLASGRFRPPLRTRSEARAPALTAPARHCTSRYGGV